MPITRSTSGRTQAENLQARLESDSGMAGTTTDAATIPDAPPTEQTTCTDRTTIRTNDRLSYTSRSKCTSVRSTRRKDILKAKEELARKEVELAAARLAALEADSSEDDDDTVSGQVESTHRVHDWPPRTTTVPVPVHEPPRTTTVPVPVHEPPRTTTVPVTIPVHEPPRTTTVPVPVPVHEPPRTTTVPAPVNESTRTDITDLAMAITTAIRGGHAAVRTSTDLPMFDGSHREWLTFAAAYEETSHALSNIENTARLRRSLRGKAREAVESLLHTSVHPEEIMKTLKLRFGRPDSIAIAEIEVLRSLPRVIDSPRELCTFANKIGNTVATLRALNKVHYLYNPELAREITDKISATLRYRWYEFAAQTYEDEPDLIKLQRFLNREAEYAAPFATPESARAEPPQQTRRTQRAYTSREVKPKCPLCNAIDHESPTCHRWSNIEQRERWNVAKKHQLCFRCLNVRSHKHRCERKACGVQNCERTHHHLLHFKKEKEEEQQEKKVDAVNTAPVTTTRCTYLKILPVTVRGPAGGANIYALLDDGSTITLIDEDIANQIGAEGPQEQLHIKSFNEKRANVSSSRRINITLVGDNVQRKIMASTMKNIQIAPQAVSERDLEDYTHIQDIKHHLKYENVKPKMLIGQDNWDLLMAESVRKGKPNQPVASLTPLGWVLHGMHTRTLGHSINIINHFEAQEDHLDEELKRFFSLESIAIEKKLPQSDPEQRALDQLEKHTTINQNGRYEVALLWKEDPVMPNNRENALHRLLNLEKKLAKDYALKTRYIEEMDKIEKKGYSEIAPSTTTPNKTWYLPHFGVTNPMKPNKLRIVHDAAARTRGKSLNDYLLTGPDLIKSLAGVLLRFRQHKFAVIADITEMFMQVKIRKEDRDALRYLWRTDPSTEPIEYRMTSLIFGATCSPSTAIFVQNKNARKHSTSNPRAAQAIKDNHYVDDYLDSFATEREAIDTALMVKKIQEEAHYSLNHWRSNSKAVLQSITEVKESEASQVNITEDSQSERVLGVIWLTDTDELAFDLRKGRLPLLEIEDNQTPTKRQVLKITMSLYDPLGYAAPVLIKAKKILQEIWRRGTSWDQPIDEDLRQQWHQWLQHLKALEKIRIPRAYPHFAEAIKLELHVFTDASESAFSAALYWRAVTATGESHISLVIAKSKVSPLKVTSIPRLELQAAILGCRMAATVKAEHTRKPENTIYWTDSKTVLAWIKNGARSYRPFVAHRIAEIEETSSVNEWRWVPTKLNVADDATREVPAEFNSTHRWYKGPQFLKEAPENWPEQASFPNVTTGEERTHHIAEKSETHRIIPDATRFSKWEVYVRTVARVLQFIQLCRTKKHSVNYKRSRRIEEDNSWQPTTKKTKNQARKKTLKPLQDPYIPISTTLLLKAEDLIVRSIQDQSFGREIETLKNGRELERQSRLRSIAAEVNNGILRLKTRIGAAVDVPERVKSPPILDGNHPAVKLYIEHVHRRLYHAGIEATTNEVRQHYWVLRQRPTVRTVVSKCLQCRIRRSKPPTPPTGDHPLTRLAHHQRPFTYVGVDYFGPLSVSVNRRTEKRYVALFTCLTTRAIHLEIAGSLSASSAIMALRRMIARRGCPTEIWSDNGTNFHGADKELKVAMDKALQEETQLKRIQWRFIPPGAPFMGGVWERLVRSVKDALYTTLKERSPTEETLATLLAEVEFVVNNRPITHVSVDPEEEEALTPNHILLGGYGSSPAVFGTFTDRDLIQRNNWRCSQRLADQFWARWMKEYLPTLQNRREPQGKGPSLKLGDMVLIADGTLPRNVWPRGIVSKVYPGKDGVVRVADVRTKGGELRRPTKKLVILPTRDACTPEEDVMPTAATSHGGRDVQAAVNQSETAT